MRRHMLIAAALAGCGWNNLPDGQSVNIGDPLWDPASVVAAEDALYVRLPAAGRLARVTPDGAELVDLGAGRLERMDLAPDGSTLVAFVGRYDCVSDDPRDTRGVKTVEDCPASFLERSTQVVTVVEGEVQTTIDVGTHFNALEFSDNGRWAVAWLDVDAGIDLSGGVVDLTSVLVLNLETGTAMPLSVGFAAETVLFDALSTRAVVLSKDSVALVELGSGTPERGTTFPLTLDPDQEVRPIGVELTPDGSYALITVQGRDDLYVLRLERPSVNLVNLSGTPSAMAVVPGDTPLDDRTVIAHRGVAKVDLIDHDDFDVEAIDLDLAVDRIVPIDRRVMLWNQGASTKDAYVLDLDSTELVEFRLENPPLALQVAPGGDFAVALTRAEGGFGDDLQGLYDRSPGLEILDLRDDRGRTAPFLLESPGVGLAFNATDTRMDALVLQDGQDYLYVLDLYTLTDQELDLEAPPVAVGSVPAGGFWITHDAALGLITFYDPASGDTTEVTGFGLLGWREGTPLSQDEGEE